MILAVVGLVTAAAEAGALVALAPLLQAVAEGRADYVGGLLGVEVRLTLSELAGIAAILVTVAFGLTSLSAAVGSRVISTHQLRRRLEIVDGYLQADWETQSQVRDGRLVAHTLDFVNQSAAGLRDVAALVRAGAGLLVFVSGAVVVSWKATLVITVATGALAAAQRPLRRAAARLSGRYSHQNVTLAEELSTLASAAKELRAAGVGAVAAEPLRQIAHEQRDVRRRADFVAALPAPILRTAGLLLIVGLVAYESKSSIIEVATLGVVVVLLYRALNYGQSLIATHTKLTVLLPVLDQLDTEHRHHLAHVALPGSTVVDACDTLALEDVSYSYPRAEESALTQVSLSVRRGEIIGVVGPSGAGKSTLADLLVGVRTPTTGRAVLDDVDIADVTDSARAALIAFVPQNVTMLPGSIAHNVDFFRNLDAHAIDDALSCVGMSESVDQMPAGELTHIGSGSRSLSGGQAQRIGLARALAGRPSFLVLDEPTSALDAESENVIVQLIEQLRHEAGIVVIAHRLSTLRHCDRVIVVENGTITGGGTLAALRSTNSFVQAAVGFGSLEWAHGSASAEGT